MGASSVNDGTKDMFVIGSSGLEVGVACLDATMEHLEIIMSQLVSLELSLIRSVFSKMITKFKFGLDMEMRLSLSEARV